MQVTIRFLQFVGASCLRNFCHHFRIYHPFTEELILHQTDLLRCAQLPEWDTSGTRLALTGRGDEIPTEVLEIVPPSLRSDFSDLVNFSTEIGLVDLFGALSHQPSRFAQKCLDILSLHQVIKPVSSIEEGVFPWGSPLSDADFISMTETGGLPNIESGFNHKTGHNSNKMENSPCQLTG